MALATRPISTEEFAETWSYLEPFLAEVDQASDQPVTFYEALTILAFTWFDELPVDAQVIEVGMGGTGTHHLVDAEVAIVTRVGLDHRAGRHPGRGGHREGRHHNAAPP